MKTNCMFLRNSWIWKAKRESTDPYMLYIEDWSFLKPATTKSYEELIESEWDEEFFSSVWNSLPTGLVHLEWMKEWCRNHLRNRMVMGSMRYGTLASKNYMDYDYSLSIPMREFYAYQTETLEPFLDMYNLQYLAYLQENGNRDHWIKECGKTLAKIDMAKNVFSWPLGSVDDGIHAVKKGEE